jgi:YhcH/YjgK/YiaL family protein
MIKDNIRNYKLYENAHPEFKRAFKIILDTPADTEDGTTDFDGIKRMVQSYETREPDTKRMEAHEKYIDIQYVAEGEEKFFFADKKIFNVTEKYNPEKDVEFYDSKNFEKSDKAEASVLNAGEFAVFFPDDAHKPSLITDKAYKIKKILLKIPVS